MGDRCIRPTPEELEDFGTPDFTIYNAGQFPCNRYTHYMTSSTSVDLHLARREMVILGTQYAGEMKKGLFSVMHYLMPKRQILSLHSGCNMGKDGDVALFFGLSGKDLGDRNVRCRHPPPFAHSHPTLRKTKMLDLLTLFI
jgi:phosphoenolpyruvate carboxykinase (ATP)